MTETKKDFEYIYAWMDLETTGNRIKDDGGPLEIALVVTDNLFNTVGSPLSMLVTKKPANPLKAMPDVVFEMHQTSGLYTEYAEALRNDFVLPTEKADTLIYNHLNNVLVNWKSKNDNAWKEGKIRLAGSGVSHFDSRWIKEFFPQTWEILDGFDDETKPTLDMGVIRRYINHFTNIKFPQPSVETPHRALSDVLSFIEQARSFTNYLNRTHEYVLDHVDNTEDWQWIMKEQEKLEYEDN